MRIHTIHAPRPLPVSGAIAPVLESTVLDSRDHHRTHMALTFRRRKARDTKGKGSPVKLFNAKLMKMFLKTCPHLPTPRVSPVKLTMKFFNLNTLCHCHGIRYRSNRREQRSWTLVMNPLSGCLNGRSKVTL